MRKYWIDGQECEAEEYKARIERLEPVDPLCIQNEEDWLLSIGDYLDFYVIQVNINDKEIYSYDKDADREKVVDIARLFIEGQLEPTNSEDWKGGRISWKKMIKFFLIYFLAALILAVIFTVLRNL